MVEERVTDGVRIAELLASEIEGREDGPLGDLAVTNAEPDVEPTVDGARAFDVRYDPGDDTDDPADDADDTGDDTADPEDDRVATVHVHADRIHLAVRTAQEPAHDAATATGLRTRPKATQPPQTLVFVESGGEVKRATDVLDAIVRARRDA